MQDALIDRKFKAIDVKGDLSWENNRENLDGIGHVLENAVSLDKYPQIITGKVEFADGFIADEVISVPWINDVNLIEMDEDGLHLGEDDVVIPSTCSLPVYFSWYYFMLLSIRIVL